MPPTARREPGVAVAIPRLILSPPLGMIAVVEALEVAHLLWARPASVRVPEVLTRPAPVKSVKYSELRPKELVTVSEPDVVAEVRSMCAPNILVLEA